MINKIKRNIFIIIPIFIISNIFFTSCLTYQELTIDTLIPAKYTFAPELKSAVIVNNSLTYKKTGIHKVKLPHKKYFVDSVWLENFAQIAVNKLKEELQNRNFFDSVYEVLKHTSLEFYDIGRFLIFGAVISANINTFVSKSFMNSLWLSARANFTYATNEIVVNGEPVYPYDYMSRIGHSIDQQWGLVAERLFVDDVEVANSPAQTYSSNYMAGDIKYVDVNNDGKVDDNDMVPIGYPRIPEIVYGFGVSAGYKNFDFSFFFQGSARSSFFIDPSAISPFVKGRNALNVIADDHWSTNNPDPFAFWPRLSDKLEKNNTVNSTWWLRDGSFLRLKSVELGYTLPKDLITKIKLKNLRVYFSGNNLLTFSKFKLWDPEMSGNGLGYPPQMIINAGIIASF